MPLIITDEQHRITFVNRMFEEVTGYSCAELVGELPDRFYAVSTRDRDFSADLETLDQGNEVSRTLELVRKDGTSLHVEQRVIPLRLDEGRSTIHVGTFVDVTDLAEAAAHWRTLANIDSLTGILNRRGGENALAALVRSAQRRDSRLAVLMCDIDHFKQVNDAHGHAVGDQVLAAVANTLQQCLREGDIVARFGGEEFLIAIAGMDEATLTGVAERLRAEVAVVDHPSVGRVTVSIGVAFWQPGESRAELLDRADAALYRAKAEGRNRVVMLSHL